MGHPTSPQCIAGRQGDVENPHQREEGEDHEMQEHEMRPKGLETRREGLVPRQSVFHGTDGQGTR